jgi:hypothetical protein
VKRLLFAGLLLATALLGGCANLSASKAPDADLQKLKTFYVQRLPADNRGIEKLLASRLTTLGYQCTSGDAEAPAAPVDAIVTYQDRWMWDITMYMIRLDVQVRDGGTRSVLASGQSMRPSLQRKSPEGMVEEVLTEIFK